MCNVSSRRRRGPPWEGLGGGNANFLSLNIYFTLSFMLARFFWLLQFFVLGVFTEKIAILVENAFFSGFFRILFWNFDEIRVQNENSIKNGCNFRKKHIKKRGGTDLARLIFFSFSSFVWGIFSICGVFFAQKMINLLKCYCNSLNDHVQPR